MKAVTTMSRRSLTPAARMRAAVGQAVESLEPRVLFTAGDPDLTFGGTGMATLDFFSRNDFGRAVAVQSDNKVLVAGWVATGITSRGNDVAVARFNVDGTLDATFGTGGKVVTHLGATTDTAQALVVQSDGRIVLAGTSRGTGTGTDFALVRYNADGSLDATFGTGGITRTDLGFLATDQLLDMKLTADGGIIAVGSSVISGNQQFAAARYTAAGLLDASFGGGDGIVVHSVENGAAQAKAVAVMADGSMVLAGSLTNYETFTSTFAAVRLLADGTLDTGFGAAGWSTFSMGGESESANALVVQDGGKIVLVGERSSGVEQDVALARLTAGGLLDTSFSGNGTGYVVTDLAGGTDWATGAVSQSDGKIVVSGQGTVDGLYRLSVVRYDGDGAPDTSFGAAGSGKVFVSFDDAGESFGEGGLAIDGEDRLIVGGQVTRGSTFDMAVTRLENAVVVNTPPTAHAGGAYGVNAGGVIALDGSGSADVDGSIVSYEWDFDYNGSSFDVDATGAAPTYSAAGLTGPATRTIALRVTDNSGATSAVATAVLTVNAAPTAHAGGAYLVNAGGSIVLSAAGSGDVDGSLAAYEWDFDYDGGSFTADATGATPTFSAVGIAGPAVRTVALRVTDDRGAVSAIAATTVTVNAAPTPSHGGPYSVTAGQSVRLNGGTSSDADGSIAAYEWDFDYDGSTFDVDAGGATATFTAPAAAGGTTRTIALRCVDNRGFASVTTTTVTINVVPPPPPPVQAPGTAVLVADPNAPGKQMLSVLGTAGSDTIRFKQDKKGNVEVRLGNRKIGTFSGMTRIVVDGGAGNDVIDASDVTIPVTIFGDSGIDVIAGGSAGDVLVGGAGDDVVAGGRGRNVLVGGTGRDALASLGGDDLVIGDALRFENDRAKMSALAAEWARSDRSLSQRVASLMSGGGKNGSAKVSGNLLDDNVVDSLVGTPDADWVLTGRKDKLVRVR